MKKIIFIIACAAACLSACADDSVLWWMVDTDKIDSSISSYDTAYLYAKADGEMQQEIGSAGADDFNFLSISTGLAKSYAQTCCFWVELLSEAQVVGTSQIASYADLQSFFTDMNGGSAPPGGTWAPLIQATAVPEPTSGLLMLLGLAGLALRRRHVA